MITPIEIVKAITDRINLSVFGTNFDIRVDRDSKAPYPHSRIFIQLIYDAPCSKGGNAQSWRGRKFYLSDHMIEDEIVKTVYLAFKLAVEHEIMEGFKVDGIIVFNPHVSYEALQAVSNIEVKRKEGNNELV